MRACCWNEAGSALATGGEAGVRVLDAATGALLHAVRLPGVLDVAWRGPAIAAVSPAS